MALIFLAECVGIQSANKPQPVPCIINRKQYLIKKLKRESPCSSEVNEIYRGFLARHLEESCGPAFAQLVCEQRHDVSRSRDSPVPGPLCLLGLAALESALLADWVTQWADETLSVKTQTSDLVTPRHRGPPFSALFSRCIKGSGEFRSFWQWKGLRKESSRFFFFLSSLKTKHQCTQKQLSAFPHTLARSYRSQNLHPYSLLQNSFADSLKLLKSSKNRSCPLCLTRH